MYEKKVGAITQPHIRTILAKKNARVLALLIFYDTRKYPDKVFKVLIRNYFCIDYLASESKKLSELPVYFGGGFKHKGKSYDKILEI